jgi:sugar phosphate isomerase/epimerase
MGSAIGRRAFLGASLAGASVGLTASLQAAEPLANFPSQPRKRLAVATYPFRSVIKSPPNPNNMSLAEFAQTIENKFQISGIEPWSRHFESTEPDYVHGLRRSFDKAGLTVVNIPCDVRAQLCGSTAENRVAGIETYHKWIDAAVILGSPSIRLHVPQGRATGDIGCAAETLKLVADYGSRKNIVVNMENDNPDSEDPFRVVKVIETVNSPFLRALPDFCNSRQLGDEQYNYRALQALFAHAFNISHVKDLEMVHGAPMRVDMGRIFAIARGAGYHGYFSMEFEDEGDPYEGTKRLIEASLGSLS